MSNRFVSIWFRYLRTDWFTIRSPHLKDTPVVLSAPVHGRMIITGTNTLAESKGIERGMALADARAILPHLEVFNDIPDLPERLLRKLAEWCIRFSPIVAIDSPDGLLIDATGCSHLWGGDDQYAEAITKKLNARGYHVRVAMADTIGVAWGMARFGKESLIITAENHPSAFMSLPPEGLRIEDEISERLHKLGLHTVSEFINMPRSSLLRRFGKEFMTRLDMALGAEIEMMQPVIPLEPYQQRLPCLEPIVTLTGIEIALQQLLETLCGRLQEEQKGLRSAVFVCYRVDGKVERVNISTSRPSRNVNHLFKLFGEKLSGIEPDLGIELFVLSAPKVEEHLPAQESMWKSLGGLKDSRLSELVDRLTNRIGLNAVQRYLPDEHYWPERSFRQATSLSEEPTANYQVGKVRPLQLLRTPEVIEVTAPIPDYPPMLFRYKNKVHQIVKADGPERIEQEWWIQGGQHRDYYRVEDEEGNRYWIFRLGHYHDKTYRWFLHGFFA